jgi:hypothetical protein
MGLGDDLKDFLSSGGVTASIFIGEAPERPASALAITPTGGLGPTRTFSASTMNAPLEHCRIQLRARAADYSACDAVMTSAYRLLSGMQTRTINNRQYYYAVPVQTPYYLGLDEASRPVIATNFDVYRAEST